jgi:hypothetical protein
MAMRRLGSVSRLTLSNTALLLIATATSLTALAHAAPVPPPMTWIGPWTTTGSQVTFVATIRKQEELWTEKFGSNRPKRIASAGCGMGEVDQLAVGPKGSVGCLAASQSNSESDYAVNFLSSSGTIKHVASAGGPGGLEGGPPVDSIPFIFGDSSFLGYLHVTADGLVQLMRITSSGHAQHVADLAGVSKPEAIAIDSGHIVITEGGTVYLYTVAGKHVSTIATGASATSLGIRSIGIRKDRIVVRIGSGRFAVFTLHGKLVHSYPVHAAVGTAMGLATYYGYAVYIGAGNAVHALKLSNGRDRIIARAGGKGWFGNGLSLQAPGVVVPRTVQRGKQYPMKLVFIPMSKIRAALG